MYSPSSSSMFGLRVARASPPPDGALFVFIQFGGVYSVANSWMSGCRFSAAFASATVCLQYSKSFSSNIGLYGSLLSFFGSWVSRIMSWR